MKRKPSTLDEKIKATFYLTTGHQITLDLIRAKRLKAGMRLGEVDKSALVREAIDLLAENEGV